MTEFKAQTSQAKEEKQKEPDKHAGEPKAEGTSGDAEQPNEEVRLQNQLDRPSPPPARTPAWGIARKRGP